MQMESHLETKTEIGQAMQDKESQDTDSMLRKQVDTQAKLNHYSDYIDHAESM